MIDDGKRIRIIRALLGMTSQSFAARIGVSVGSLTAWERSRAIPHQDKRNELQKLCQEHGIAILPSGMPVPARDTLSFKEKI